MSSSKKQEKDWRQKKILKMSIWPLVWTVVMGHLSFERKGDPERDSRQWEGDQSGKEGTVSFVFLKWFVHCYQLHCKEINVTG